MTTGTGSTKLKQLPKTHGQLTPEELADAFDSPYECTDKGNGERLAAHFGSTAKYCPDRKNWLHWNGKYWDWDRVNKIQFKAKTIINQIFDEATACHNNGRHNDLLKHYIQSQREARINSMINLAKSELMCVLPIEMIDSSEWLLNANNGTIDLRTGELKPHDRVDYITRIIDIDYDPAASSKTFNTFLNRIFSNHQDLIAYVQSAIGYSITGSQAEIAFFFCHGSGWNGKGTLLGAVRDILGEYAAEVDPSAFMTNKGNPGGPDEAIASLHGKRLALSTELTDGQRLSVGLIKRMTGGEQLRCERKYEHGYMFKPTHKLWLCGNHEPDIRDSTISIWRRLKKIPFAIEIPEEERIKGFREMLVAQDGPAILAWVVRGCLNWQDDGLNDPPEVKTAVSDYRARQDILHDFITECCDIQPTNRSTVAELHKAYTSWCVENSQDSIQSRTFNRLLREKGFNTAPGTDHKTTWHGIALHEK